MKKIFLVMLCAFMVLITNAQTGLKQEKTTPVFSLGLGSGINSYTSVLGLSGNLKVADKIFLQGGLGAGTWGGKYSIGLRYDMRQGSGWAYGLGYSKCSGMSNLDLNINQNGTSEQYKIDLLEADVINVKATRNWMVSKSVILYLDLGYAFPLENNPWKVTNGPDLSNLAKTTLNLLAPGGMILGAGITIGI